MRVLSKIDVCMLIRYLTALSVTGATIEWKIREVYSNVLSRQMINECTMFLHCCIDLNVHAGQPSDINEDAINTVH